MKTSDWILLAVLAFVVIRAVKRDPRTPVKGRKVEVITELRGVTTNGGTRGVVVRQPTGLR